MAAPIRSMRLLCISSQEAQVPSGCSMMFAESRPTRTIFLAPPSASLIAISIPSPPVAPVIRYTPPLHSILALSPSTLHSAPLPVIVVSFHERFHASEQRTTKCVGLDVSFSTQAVVMKAPRSPWYLSTSIYLVAQPSSSKDIPLSRPASMARTGTRPPASPSWPSPPVANTVTRMFPFARRVANHAAIAVNE